MTKTWSKSVHMRTGVELTRSQKEKEQREESKAESPPTDAPQPKELERRPVLALGLPARSRTTSRCSICEFLVSETCLRVGCAC